MGIRMILKQEFGRFRKPNFGSAGRQRWPGRAAEERAAFFKPTAGSTDCSPARAVARHNGACYIERALASTS